MSPWELASLSDISLSHLVTWQSHDIHMRPYYHNHTQLVLKLVEPPNKGQYGTNDFVPCREVVSISEGPLKEVQMYTTILARCYGIWVAGNLGI